MNFIELSVSETKQQSIELAKKIEQNSRPDVIVFIAKGAYMIRQWSKDSTRFQQNYVELKQIGAF